MRTLVLSCPGEQQGSEQGNMKKESLGGEGSCILGSQAGPHVGYWNPGSRRAGGEGLGASHFLSLCPPQAPAGQRPLPGPGLPEGAPVPGHARCCPLGQQASEELQGEAPGKPAAPMLFNVVQRERPSNRRKRHFSQAMMVVSGDCGSQGTVAPHFKNQSSSPWKPAAVRLQSGSSFALPCTASGLHRPEASITGETTRRNGRADAFFWA